MIEIKFNIARLRLRLRLRSPAHRPGPEPNMVQGRQAFPQPVTVRVTRPVLVKGNGYV